MGCTIVLYQVLKQTKQHHELLLPSPFIFYKIRFDYNSFLLVCIDVAVEEGQWPPKWHVVFSSKYHFLCNTATTRNIIRFLFCS